MLKCVCKLDSNHAMVCTMQIEVQLPMRALPRKGIVPKEAGLSVGHSNLQVRIRLCEKIRYDDSSEAETDTKVPEITNILHTRHAGQGKSYRCIERQPLQPPTCTELIPGKAIMLETECTYWQPHAIPWDTSLIPGSSNSFFDKSSCVKVE